MSTLLHSPTPRKDPISLPEPDPDDSGFEATASEPGNKEHNQHGTDVAAREIIGGDEEIFKVSDKEKEDMEAARVEEILSLLWEEGGHKTFDDGIDKAHEYVELTQKSDEAQECTGLTQKSDNLNKGTRKEKITDFFHSLQDGENSQGNMNSRWKLLQETRARETFNSTKGHRPAGFKEVLKQETCGQAGQNKSQRRSLVWDTVTYHPSKIKKGLQSWWDQTW